MAATRADLERLIHQATPRVEDVRTVDRTDIIRRNHGHLNLREVVNSVDALEFSVDSFISCMKELSDSNSSENGAGTSATAPTAVHGLLRCVESLQLLTPAAGAAASAVPIEAEDESQACLPAEEPKEGWAEVAAEAKRLGGESFKSKDFASALTHYSTAVRSTPAGDESLSALYSNRSAALLQLGHLAAALGDAQRCVELAPKWPKGHFRSGCSLRQLDRLEEAAAAFRAGQALEPSNKDWEREVEKTERQHCALPSTQARQLVWHLLPELLQAWIRAGAAGGILQVQVNGELEDLGTPKWQRVRDGKEPAKAQIRYAFLEEKGYMTNLAANLQKPPSEGVGVVDLNGHPLKIADVRPFVATAGSATFQIDVRHGGKMVAIIARVACDEEVLRFAPPHKDPAAPKGTVEGALQAQARTGFPKVLPRFLGFQSFPGGDVNFPVIDLERDCPGAVPAVNEGGEVAGVQMFGE